MNEIIIPTFKDKTELQDFLNENLSFLYIPDKILEFNNEISKLENAQELRDEYFSQLTSFSFDVYNLEKTFENNEYNFEQKLKILFRSIESNYELISSWYEDPDFSEIVQNDLILKNLILIYKHTGKDPREFIKEQKQAGLKNNMISGILNFDPLDFLLRLLQKSIINFDPNDLASDLFKEILVTVFIQRAFNVCIESIKTCKIPTEAFEEQKFIELIYLFRQQILVDKTEVTMEDVQLIIELPEILLNNYHKIRENYNFKEGGADEYFEAVRIYFGFEKIDNKFNINPDNAKINLLEIFPYKNFTPIELQFIFSQLIALFTNISHFYNEKSILFFSHSPQLLAIFAISNFEKYHVNFELFTKLSHVQDFANELINILKNQPKYLEQVVKIFSGYSIDNVLLETISKNDYIQNNHPNFLELVIACKIKYIREKTQIDPQNINFKAAAATEEDDPPEVINAIISLGDSIDLIDSQVINFIRQDVSKYAPVITNIVKAESVNDITPETINFFASLEDTNETKILLSRFDLFEPIVEKMFEKNIKIEKTNKLIHLIQEKFRFSIPQKFSDEIIYSNPEFENSFNCLLQTLSNNNNDLNYFYDHFPKIPEAEKMRKEIRRKLHMRNYPNDSPEIINAILSLGDSIDLIDSRVINFIRQNVPKYTPVITNILKAESINDITSETINFFANLKDTNETKILLSRFDLFEPIVKKMYEKNIDTEKINNVINWTCNNFKDEVFKKFSDKIIYFSATLKNSFLYLLYKSSDSHLKYLNDFFPESSKAEKMRKEIEHELHIRNYTKEAPKILKQKIKNMLSFGIPDIISLVAIAIVIGLTFGAGIISSPLFITLIAIFGVASLFLSFKFFKNLASWFKNRTELTICNKILLERKNYNIIKEPTQPVSIETQSEVEQQNGAKPKVYDPLLQTPEVNSK